MTNSSTSGYFRVFSVRTWAFKTEPTGNIKGGSTLFYLVVEVEKAFHTSRDIWREIVIPVFFAGFVSVFSIYLWMEWGSKRRWGRDTGTEIKLREY